MPLQLSAVTLGINVIHRCHVHRQEHQCQAALILDLEDLAEPIPQDEIVPRLQSQLVEQLTDLLDHQHACEIEAKMS